MCTGVRAWSDGGRDGDGTLKKSTPRRDDARVHGGHQGAQAASGAAGGPVPYARAVAGDGESDASPPSR
jgi:hypothetical protein